MTVRITAMLVCCLSLSACANAHEQADKPMPDAGASAGANAGANAGAGAGECASGRGVQADNARLSASGRWTLSCATGSESADAVRAPGIAFTVTFDDAILHANGGCNDLSGGYTLSGKRMTFENVAIVTRRSCDDAKNLADRSFSELMSQAFTAEFLESKPDRLRLTSDSGQVLVFEAASTTP